jgi:hypothetical protein
LWERLSSRDLSRRIKSEVADATIDLRWMPAFAGMTKILQSPIGLRWIVLQGITGGMRR